MVVGGAPVVVGMIVVAFVIAEEVRFVANIIDSFCRVFEGGRVLLFCSNSYNIF